MWYATTSSKGQVLMRVAFHLSVTHFEALLSYIGGRNTGTTEGQVRRHSGGQTGTAGNHCQKTGREKQKRKRGQAASHVSLLSNGTTENQLDSGLDILYTQSVCYPCQPLELWNHSGRSEDHPWGIRALKQGEETEQEADWGNQFQRGEAIVGWDWLQKLTAMLQSNRGDKQQIGLLHREDRTLRVGQRLRLPRSRTVLHPRCQPGRRSEEMLCLAGGGLQANCSR